MGCICITLIFVAHAGACQRTTASADEPSPFRTPTTNSLGAAPTQDAVTPSRHRERAVPCRDRGPQLAPLAESTAATCAASTKPPVPAGVDDRKDVRSVS
jgi:hypothetical protein